MERVGRTLPRHCWMGWMESRPNQTHASGKKRGGGSVERARMMWRDGSWKWREAEGEPESESEPGKLMSPG